MSPVRAAQRWPHIQLCAGWLGRSGITLLCGADRLVTMAEGNTILSRLPDSLGVSEYDVSTLAVRSDVAIMSQDQDPVEVLSSLLSDLRDGKLAAPSRTIATAALALCDELSNHLRTLTLSPSASLLSTACVLQCTSSESDSETPSKGTSKSRPSARSRARLRRQQQQLLLLQQPQHDPAQQAQHVEWQQQQWQQWQWQWREHQQLPRQPLPGVLEQQEQHFRSSLWNGQWLVMPVAPPHATTPSSHVAMAAVAASGGGPAGGYPMQLSTHGMVVTDDTTLRQATWTGGGGVMPRAIRASMAATHGVDLKTRVQRCMKVHRWERMQRVWTDWMRLSSSREETEAEAVMTSDSTTRLPRSAAAGARPAWHEP